ncbi:MAG: hypothetical protein ACRDXX_14565, partial [Stackebrandtia sp.]
MPPQQARPFGVTRRTTMKTGVVAAAGGLLVFRSPVASALGFQDPEEDVYAELLTRWAGILVGGEVSDDNEDYAKAVAAQDKIAKTRLDTIITDPGANTPWEDLPLGQDEEDASTMTSVANRLREIAVPYATPASELYGDASAAEAVAAGAKILVDSVYHEGQDQYANWWDWEIGTPRSLLDACVLIGDALDGETLTNVVAAVDHFIPDPTRMIDGALISTGANRVDLCKSTALRGALGGAADKLT